MALDMSPHGIRAVPVIWLARVVWFGLALLMAAVLLVLLVFFWHIHGRAGCTSPECLRYLGWLEALGVPFEAHAILYMLALGVPVVVWLGLALWMFSAQPKQLWGYVYSLFFLLGWYSEINIQYIRGSLSQALSYFFAGVGFYELSSSSGLLVFGEYLRGILKFSADVLLVLMAVTFPTGVLTPRWTAWYLGVFAFLALGYSLPFLRPTVFNFGNLPFVWSLLVNFGLLFGLVYAVLQHDRANDASMRWWVRRILPALIFNALIYGLDLLLTVLVKRGVFSSFIPIPLFVLVVHLAGGVGMVWLAVAVAKAIVREQLFDIRFVLNRALAYSILIASSVGLYALIVGGLGGVLKNSEFGLSVLAAGVLAVLFQPMLLFFRGFANRLFYGHRSDPYQALSVFGRQLEAARNPEELPQQIVQTIASTLRLPYVAMQTRNPDGSLHTVDVGSRLGTLLEFAMLVKGTAVGSLLVSPRHLGENFSASERHLLEDLAAQAAVAMREVLLSKALQASKQDIVLAREEERKRIRRDLHDGLGASLTSVSMNLQLSRNLLSSDPNRAEGLLESSAQGVQAAIADIRRLVYGLRPPALDDLGLEGALRQQVGQMLGVTTEVQILPLEPLPAAVEVAAYRIVSEALNNISKHAKAKRVKLVVQMTEDGLMLEVADDGVGFLPSQAGGLGLSSMRERALELGGVFEVEHTGGTRVLAWLPLIGRT